MDLEDFDASLLRGPADGDVPVEATGPEESGIQNVRPVRGGDDNHELILREAVHFAENLIEGLFPLVMPAAEPRSALPADGVDFVDEDDGRRVFLGDFEQI